MLPRARSRVAFFLGALTLGLIGLWARYFQLQVAQAVDLDHSRTRATRDEPLHGLRGRLFDRRGGLLAHSERVADLRVWKPGLRDTTHRDALFEALHELLGTPVETLQERLDSGRYPRLARHLSDPSILDAVEELRRDWRFRSLEFEWAERRTYPSGPLFAPLVGYVDAEGCGVAGLEQRFDQALHSRSGQRKVVRDGRGRVLASVDEPVIPATDGEDVVLSLCPMIQREAERELDALQQQYDSRWAQAIVVDTRSGEVLALAQRPAPPQGRPRSEEAVREHYLHAAQEQYTPGSTIKPLMLALLMERGLVTLDEPIDCGNGAHRFGGRTLHDHDGGYGVLDVAEVLVHSSNIGMAKLACRLVPEEARRGDASFGVVLDFFRRLGFGQTVLDLPREQCGMLQTPEYIDRNNTLVSMSFGHEIAVTALQMVVAASALVMDGVQRPLTFTRVDGGEATETQRWLRADVARSVRPLLQRVVLEGGSRKHAPEDYTVGGKTGTAMKETDRTKDCMSFFGFGPVDDPRVLVLVVVDEPQNVRFSSEVAAPTALRLLGSSLRLLGVAPESEKVQRAVAAAEARR